MTHKIKVFIDDERFPPDISWLVCRNYVSFFNLVYNLGRIPDVISFDHDLGDDNHTRDGYAIAKTLVELDLNGEMSFPEGFEFKVHSANPVGSKNINEYLKNYLRYRANNE